MSKHDSEQKRKKEEDHPAKDNPRDHGEIPRNPDNSDDDERDPLDK